MLNDVADAFRNLEEERKTLDGLNEARASVGEVSDDVDSADLVGQYSGLVDQLVQDSDRGAFGCERASDVAANTSRSAGRTCR